MSDPKDPKAPSPHGGPGSIGKGLGEDLDFESDALLDSLLFDNSAPASAAASPPSVRLHSPASRDYPDDEVTMVGRADDLLQQVIADDGTSGLEDLAHSDIDDLLSTNNPPSVAPERVALRPDAGITEIPSAPKAPAAPRPGLPFPSASPRPSLDATAKPPAINPAGPPARQPFPPTLSPRAPGTVPRPGELPAKFAVGRPRADFVSSTASLARTSPPPPNTAHSAYPPRESPPSSVPPSPPSEPPEDDEERTSIFSSGPQGSGLQRELRRPGIRLPPNPETWSSWRAGIPAARCRWAGGWRRRFW